MSSNLNPAQIAAVAAVANGNTADVHPRTVTALTKRGLVVERDGKLALTDAGLEVFVANGGTVAEAEKAAGQTKRSRKPRSCGCGCGDLTNGGLWKPGHDARWAGHTGRAVAADLGYVEDESDLVVGEHVALRAPEGTSDALIVKATNVALAAMGKAQAKAAKVSA